MFMKIIFLFLLIQISLNEERPKIKILEVKDPKCSTELGRVDFTAKYSYDSVKDLNSYFLLFFKDKENKKRSSICYLPKTSGGNNTESNEPTGDSSSPSYNADKTGIIIGIETSSTE